MKSIFKGIGKVINKGEVKRLDTGICWAGNGQVTYPPDWEVSPKFFDREASKEN